MFTYSLVLLVDSTSILDFLLHLDIGVQSQFINMLYSYQFKFSMSDLLNTHAGLRGHGSVCDHQRGLLPLANRFGYSGEHSGPADILQHRSHRTQAPPCGCDLVPPGLRQPDAAADALRTPDDDRVWAQGPAKRPRLQSGDLLVSHRPRLVRLHHLHAQRVPGKLVIFFFFFLLTFCSQFSLKLSSS